jgi:hypothetical protein
MRGGDRLEYVCFTNSEDDSYNWRALGGVLKRADMMREALRNSQTRVQFKFTTFIIALA